MKTNWRKHDKTDFLGSVDIDEMGVKEITLTIENVLWKNVKVRGKQEMHRIATFKEKVKPMIINVTNGKAIKKVVNSQYLDDWINLEIVIYIKEGVRMGSDITEALRIKSVKKVATKVKAKKSISDEGFTSAIEAIEQGNVTKEQVISQYQLTEKQLEKLC